MNKFLIQRVIETDAVMWGDVIVDVNFINVNEWYNFKEIIKKSFENDEMTIRLN